MQLINFITVTIMLALTPASIMACKCIGRTGGTNIDATRDCCRTAGGSFEYGDDCTWNSIKDNGRVDSFNYCCSSKSLFRDC